MIETYVGLARYNEYGGQEGGLMGDQLQTSIPDANGELATIPLTDFLEGASGASVYRLTDIDQANLMAKGIVKACDNPYIGYDVTNRNSILAYGINTGYKNGRPAECDNWSLVRVVIKYATDIDPGDFNAQSARRVLNANSFFMEPITLTEATKLYLGDVVIRDDNNMMAIVGIGDPRPVPSPTPGGTTDYNDLENKPSLNGVTIEGDKTQDDYNIQGGGGTSRPRVEDERLIFQ